MDMVNPVRPNSGMDNGTCHIAFLLKKRFNADRWCTEKVQTLVTCNP